MNFLESKVKQVYKTCKTLIWNYKKFGSLMFFIICKRSTSKAQAVLMQV